jgi:hypothetical protein
MVFETMDPLYSLFLDRLQKVRNHLQNTFGFQYMTDVLSDTEPRYAIVFPEEVYADHALRGAIQCYTNLVFADYDLTMVYPQYKDSETFEVDRCGSRFRTVIYDHILEFGVSLRMEPIREGLARYIPKIPTWSILTVHYDDFYADLNTTIQFYASESWAVLDSEDKDVRKAARSAEILQKMQGWLSP